MDDLTIPHPMAHPNPPILIRACEVSRLQDQILAQAYGRVCPEIRRPLGSTPAEVSLEHQNHNPFKAARAAGA